jgi:hypothetical protein
MLPSSLSSIDTRGSSFTYGLFFWPFFPDPILASGVTYCSFIASFNRSFELELSESNRTLEAAFFVESD